MPKEPGALELFGIEVAPPQGRCTSWIVVLPPLIAERVKQDETFNRLVWRLLKIPEDGEVRTWVVGDPLQD